jgi:2-methylisoborneol synthase
VVVPPLYCPDPVRIDESLGTHVNDLLLAWIDELGTFPSRPDHVHTGQYGRFAMLVHPDTDDPDRLLLAAKCIAALFGVDDYYCDDERSGSDPALLGPRLGLAQSALDPAHLTGLHAAELEAALRADPILVALRSYIEHAAGYASPAQLARIRHETVAMFLTMNEEAAWRASGAIPSVWKYLAHRQPNSFLPCMTLIDVVGGYEIPATVYAHPAVRRATALAGSATIIANDLYSMAKERVPEIGDFNLPTVLVAERGCSLQDAVEISVGIHDDVMRAFEATARELLRDSSPELARFLAGLRAWIGGSREWHARSGRYHSAPLLTATG